jgi:hypothetical protein
MIFIVMVLVVTFFIAIWQFDFHKTLFVKAKSRNAGDAAALAAARWQGIALNLIGDLNILQALAIQDGLDRGLTEFPEAVAIADLEARLCYVGPMIALVAAQQAGKNNGIYNNALYTDAMLAHAAEVRSEYNDRYPDPPYVNQPSPPTAWDDYASMIQAVADNGVAVFCDNVHLYTDYVNYDHYLLMPAFYDAISSADWCWFFFNAMDLLENYTSWQEWPPLPIIREPEPINAEYFGLGLRKVSRLATLPRVRDADGNLQTALNAIEDAAGVDLSNQVATVEAAWYCYDDYRWRPWTDFIPKDFPFIGDVRRQYDYVGADAAVRIETDTQRLTPRAARADITWSAAAKPFGFLEDSEKPNAYSIVLPAFEDVRLIPIDTSTAPAGGSRPGWYTHIKDHLPVYVQTGLGGLEPGCWYCAQLRAWEDYGFRADGLDWLRRNSDSCYSSGGGGGGGDGGNRRGH